MVEITQWIYLIVPGFVYLSALFFITLSFERTNKKDIGRKIHEYLCRDNLLYPSIAIIFLSYVIGLSIHLAFERIISWICLTDNNNAITLFKSRDVSVMLLEAKKSSYATLIMIRHLIISTLFLVVSLCIWFKSWRRRLFLICASIIFEIIFVFAYLLQKEILDKLNH